MTNPKPVPGAGLFIGAQDRSNEVIDRPPAEYVFRIPDSLDPDLASYAAECAAFAAP